MMLRILFIYARQTPQLSYKQGMHEILAPIIYVIEKDKIIASDLQGYFSLLYFSIIVTIKGCFR